MRKLLLGALLLNTISLLLSCSNDDSPVVKETIAPPVDYTIFPITTPLTPNGEYDNDGTIFLIDNTIIVTTVPIITPIPQGESNLVNMRNH